MRLFRTGAGTRGNTAQVECPSLGLRDPGGALWGKLGLEGSMVRWAWSHPLLLLDKPAEAQKVPHFTARAVKEYRGGPKTSPYAPPMCSSRLVLFKPSSCFQAMAPCPFQPGKVTELQVGLPSGGREGMW